MNENKKLKILVTDNDRDFLATAEHKLSMRGFQVFVSQLAEAVQVIKETPVDTIFMDFNKTKTEGAALLAFIESLTQKPDIQYFGKEN